MTKMDRVLFRAACIVVLLFGLYGVMQLYAAHYRAHTHDTIAQRVKVDDCIVAGGGMGACTARYYPQGAYCDDAMTWTCFSTIFKVDGE